MRLVAREEMIAPKPSSLSTAPLTLSSTCLVAVLSEHGDPHAAVTSLGGRMRAGCRMAGYRMAGYRMAGCRMAGCLAACEAHKPTTARGGKFLPIYRVSGTESLGDWLSCIS